MLLAVLPGWGHILLGREGLGLSLFTGASMSAFTLVNGLWIYLGELRGILIGISSLALAGFLIFSLADALRLSSPLRLERLKRLRDQLLWEGSLEYLREDFLAAEQRFLECARLDLLDAEPVFRAGAASARRGERREARRLLARARRLDVERKWEWEIGNELGRLETAAPAPPAAPSPASEGGLENAAALVVSRTD
jgi:hypothetical protein